MLLCARIKRNRISRLDSHISIFLEGSIDQSNIKIPLAATQINATNPNRKHEVGRIGNNLRLRWIRLVIGWGAGCDNAVGEGIDGQTEKYNDEKNDKDDGDHPSHKGSVCFLLFVAVECCMWEEVAFQDCLLYLAHLICYLIIFFECSFEIVSRSQIENKELRLWKIWS